MRLLAGNTVDRACLKKSPSHGPRTNPVLVVGSTMPRGAARRRLRFGKLLESPFAVKIFVSDTINIQNKSVKNDKPSTPPTFDDLMLAKQDDGMLGQLTGWLAGCLAGGNN